MPVWEGWRLGQIGWHQARLDDRGQARTHCAAALALARCHDDPEGEAVVPDSLGYLSLHAADYAQATHCYEQALTAFNGLGNTSEEADTQVSLGEAHYPQCQREQARSRWEAALEHYRTQRRPEESPRGAGASQPPARPPRQGLSHRARPPAGPDALESVCLSAMNKGACALPPEAGVESTAARPGGPSSGLCPAVYGRVR
ncbi:hypothetical protein [Amycolatopsis circi]|uniref:hypothetical protein n=1 Tax=Amycolatopsis circi TaxID=871959 RepID=UPI0013BE9B30|nr:hypothetical protein [Amycolatopsis circi]